MDDERQIRSYHRAWSTELTLHSFGGDLRPWKPIPARALIWLPLCEILMFALSAVPPSSLLLSALGWEFTFLAIPLALAWLLTVASVEGRRLHVTALASGSQLFRSKHLDGMLQPVRAQGDTWKPGRVRVVRDSRR